MLLASSSQFFSRLGRPVIAIPDDETAGGFEEFGEHREFVGVGRGNRDAADEPRPPNAHMHPKAVEGLPEKGVLAEGGFTPEAAAAVGAGEQARLLKGIESTSAKVGSWGARARNSCQRRSLTFQRLAA